MISKRINSYNSRGALLQVSPLFCIFVSLTYRITLTTMPRTYDKIVRYYSSWFADLEDADKGFTDAERWLIVSTIARCQMDETTDHLDELPPTIKRGLQMATLREQIERMLERSERMRSRGSRGGTARGSAVESPDRAAERARVDAQKAAERAETAREIEEAKQQILELKAAGKPIPRALQPFAHAMGLDK